MLKSRLFSFLSLFLCLGATTAYADHMIIHDIDEVEMAKGDMWKLQEIDIESNGVRQHFTLTTPTSLLPLSSDGHLFLYCKTDESYYQIGVTPGAVYTPAKTAEKFEKKIISMFGKASFDHKVSEPDQDGFLYRLDIDVRQDKKDKKIVRKMAIIATENMDCWMFVEGEDLSSAEEFFDTFTLLN